MKDKSAFPTDCQDGMTLKQYAAITLKQPDSGLDWLDEMIRKAKRDEFAGQYLVGMGDPDIRGTIPVLAAECYIFADALIAESNKGVGDENV